MFFSFCIMLRPLHYNDLYNLSHIILIYRRASTRTKKINNSNPPSTPRSIVHNDTIINNPKKIADIANQYYIDAIAILHNDIPKIPVTPIEILKNIYPRNPNEFIIPLPTVKDIRNIVLK